MLLWLSLDNEAGIRFLTAGEELALDIRQNNDIHIPNDNAKLLFGAAQDASIYYDGTDLQINPQEVGSGSLKIQSSVIAYDPVIDKELARFNWELLHALMKKFGKITLERQVNATTFH